MLGKAPSVEERRSEKARPETVNAVTDQPYECQMARCFGMSPPITSVIPSLHPTRIAAIMSRRFNRTARAALATAAARQAGGTEGARRPASAPTVPPAAACTARCTGSTDDARASVAPASEANPT
jgi:hypothetical protein